MSQAGLPVTTQQAGTANAMNQPLTDYEATYRRSELALPLLVGIAIVGGLALAAITAWTPPTGDWNRGS